MSVGARSLGPGGATRSKAGVVSLGAGVIAVPIASMIYVGLAWMTVVAMTACVDASVMVCLAGPLVGTGLLFATTLALGGVVIAVSMLLAAGAALVRERVAYVAAAFGAGGVMVLAGAVCLFRASAVRTTSLESAELGPELVALAIGAPLLAVGLACWVAAAVRALTAAVVAAAAPKSDGNG